MKRIPARVFVTNGWTSENQGMRKEDVQELALNGTLYDVVFKPLSGIFHLAKNSHWQEGSLADAFEWPPPDGDSSEAIPHGIEGKMFAIVEVLLERAARVMKTKTSVEDCIQGAVLAMDALELIGNRTPTTCVEALALKHELELSAECMFYGLQSELDIESRLAAVETEVEWLSERFHKPTREESRLDAELGVVERLIMVLRENDRFEEEQKATVRIRDLRRRLIYQRQCSLGGPRIFAWVASLGRRYMNWLFKQPGNFALGIATIVLFATSIYLFVLPKEPITTPHSASIAFWHAVENVVAAHPPDEVHHYEGFHSKWVLLFTPVFMIAGIFHIGVFIAFVYTRLTRK
jgi:hypothetical protein